MAEPAEWEQPHARERAPALACAVERVRSHNGGAEHRAPTGGLLCDVVPSLQGG
eukprot:CAMPEP_0185436592 /NCGR_PEP_ID=MMETSP1365-20130426/28309_1 /TAXON_ID=38817 /ORGANISM="Gephyrocapsa oceanica, Strain RCC1303" /LENGTH=53 /DNA_ID=CAMNT_0028041427 /DNA_START=1 /DNA_END=159 /DNA_ORIENTATION=-